MPEPLLYLKATVAAAAVSAIVLLAVSGTRRDNASLANISRVLAITFGLAIGYYILDLQIAWPPRGGLDRFLTIIMPAVISIELLAAVPRIPPAIAWLLRITLAACLPRILLHGSVYLTDWTFGQTTAIIGVCAILLVGCWLLLHRLSERDARLSDRRWGVSIPLALCLSIQCAAMTVMMAGYIKGGAAALPIVATLAATTVVTGMLNRRAGNPATANLAAIIGIGVVSLFSVLFIGRFFGRISTGFALTMLFAPLLCWATELPGLRTRKPWLVPSLRLLLVAIPLMIVLVLAKRDFDRDMSPLLVQRSLESR